MWLKQTKEQEAEELPSFAPAHSVHEPQVVSWSGPDDEDNPRNWSSRKKRLVLLTVTLFTLIDPMASVMVAPALPQMSQSLNVQSPAISQMMLSAFVLASAFGPLLLGPISELYGRVLVLQLANLVFLVFNSACGLAQNGVQMIVLRFFAGLGGSAPLAVGGGVLADCFSPDQRGKAMAIYSLAALIGPAAGPIAGGFVAQRTSWRWMFWAVSVADAAVQIMGLLFLKETWPPKILEQKAKRLRKMTGNCNICAKGAPRMSFAREIQKSLMRPLRMLFTQPIIIALAVYMAYLYGLLYLVLSSFSTLYTSPNYYHEPTNISGLHYIAVAIGYFLGSQITAHFNGWLYLRLKKRHGNEDLPEFRIPVMVPCAILLPLGLFWYGWSAQAKIHWIVPDIGVAVLSAATACGYQAVQTYVTDAYTTYTASAVAAISVLRMLAAFSFPIFAPDLYLAFGYGWGNSLLGFIAILIGVPTPWILWRYGRRLRARSTFAAG